VCCRRVTVYSMRYFMKTKKFLSCVPTALELCARAGRGVICVVCASWPRREGGARAFCTRISFSPPGAGLHTPPCTPRAQRQPPGHMPLALRMCAPCSLRDVGRLKTLMMRLR
jgi:hypothetical protein